MTFPQSAFPRTTFDGTPCSYRWQAKVYRAHGLDPCDRCGSDECSLPWLNWRGDHNKEPRLPPRSFPLLRSSPLWRQTWIDNSLKWESGSIAYGKSGRWWPPLRCGGERIPALRVNYRATGSVAGRRFARPLSRIYSSPGCRCEECMRNAQTIELMLVGIAWQLAQWPDDWEHRCWFGATRYAEMPPNIQVYVLEAKHRCSCGNRQSLLDSTGWSREVDHIAWKWIRGLESRRRSEIDMEPTSLFPVPPGTYFTGAFTNEPATEDDIRAILTERGWTVSW